MVARGVNLSFLQIRVALVELFGGWERGSFHSISPRGSEGEVEHRLALMDVGVAVHCNLVGRDEVLQPTEEGGKAISVQIGGMARKAILSWVGTLDALEGRGMEGGGAGGWERARGLGRW